ncbi:MAG: hypothetical protein K8T20_08735 [Planctomycetes bacterium]|nr:hypothetical protein [Planctomycetota bacterium]
MKRASIILLVLLAGNAWAESVEVEASMKDGSLVKGSLLSDSFTVEGSLGTLKVILGNLVSITTNGEEVVVKTSDGSTLRGRLAPAEIRVHCAAGDLALKVADLKALSVIGRGGGAPPGTGNRDRKPPVNPPPPNPGPRPAVELKPQMTPLGTIEFQASVAGRPLRTPDGKTLCAINLSDLKLVLIDWAGFKVRGQCEVPPGSSALAISPDGTTAFVAGSRKFAVVDLASGTLTSTFDIELAATDVLATDAHTALVLTAGEISVVDIAKQGVVRRVPGPGGRVLDDSRPDRILLSTGFIKLPAPGTDPSAMDVAFSPKTRSTAGELTGLTPDGRIAVTADGQVLRRARSYVADFLKAGLVDHNSCASGLTKTHQVLLFSDDGSVKVIDSLTLETKSTTPLNVRVEWAFVDEEAGTMSVFASAWSAAPRRTGVGNWFRFALPK